MVLVYVINKISFKHTWDSDFDMVLLEEILFLQVHFGCLLLILNQATIIRYIYLGLIVSYIIQCMKQNMTLINERESIWAKNKNLTYIYFYFQSLYDYVWTISLCICASTKWLWDNNLLFVISVFKIME